MKIKHDNTLYCSSLKLHIGQRNEDRGLKVNISLERQTSDDMRGLAADTENVTGDTYEMHGE